MIAVPDLDTADFDSLVEEGRGLIPRFAPGWTDHNLHDPGMTLLDLLAWFVDQQMYRIGFVSDAHIAAFAALLGVVPQGAAPAGGLIWPATAAVQSDTPIARNSRAHPREQPGLPFAVTDAIGLRANAIDGVTARSGTASRAVKIDSETGAIALDPRTDTIALSFEPAPIRGTAPIALGLAYAKALPDLGKRPPASVTYCDSAGTWRRGRARWRVAPGHESGVLVIRIAKDAKPITTIRLDLGTGLPRRLVPARLALNVIPVTQIEILEQLKIGEGSGWPDLEIPLGIESGSTPVSAVTLVVGPDNDRWRASDSLVTSSPDDRHFVFDRERGIVRFGNGVNGRAMPSGHQISRGTLRVTRGAQGNLPAGAGWTVTGISSVGATGFGTNLAPVAGGSDAWTRDEFLTELRRRVRRRAAMLTNPEMIAAAMQLDGYGIEQAEVLSRFHPMLPQHEVPGARTLLLRPTRDVDADDVWLDAIEQALAARRVLGEWLTVATVVPVPVAVDAELLVAAGADQERIRDAAVQVLRERLSLDKRRDDQTIEPWPAGRPVTGPELETLLASVEGVIAVTSLRFGRADGKLARGLRPPLGRLEVAVADVPVIRLTVEH